MIGYLTVDPLDQLAVHIDSIPAVGWHPRCVRVHADRAFGISDVEGVRRSRILDGVSVTVWIEDRETWGIEYAMSDSNVALVEMFGPGSMETSVKVVRALMSDEYRRSHSLSSFARVLRLTPRGLRGVQLSVSRQT